MQEAMQKYLPLVGRILIMAIFLVVGVEKVMNPSGTKAFMAMYNMPLLSLGLIVAIVAEIGGGALIVAGYQTRWVALGLFLYMIPVTLIFHTKLSDPLQQLMFMKNLAILGGLLMLGAFGAGPISVDGWLVKKSAS